MLLIIDNYDSFTYNLHQAVAPFFDDVKVIRNDQLTVDDVRDMQPDGIILSPGPGRPEQAGICVDLILALVSRDIRRTPLLGVCLGHQAIAHALGGRVIQADEICHGKQDLIFHKAKGLYRHLPKPFSAGRYHSLVVERDTLPRSLCIESENSRQLIMGIRHIKLPLYGVQFHPESILTPEGQTLLTSFCNDVLMEGSRQ